MDTLVTISPTTCEGRLTVESGVAVPIADQSARTTLYFTPYKGNVIDLYPGSYWVRRTFSERSLSLSGLTASLPYDIFAYDSSGGVDTTTWVGDDDAPLRKQSGITGSLQG